MGPLLIFKTWEDFFAWVYPKSGEKMLNYKGDIQIEEEKEVIFTSVMDALRSVEEG